MSSETAVLSRWIPWSAPAREADWEALYAEQMPRVYNFFRYRVGDGPEAEDLTSATFERAWRSRARYRGDLAGFAAWLFAIARNLAVDHYRARRPHVPLEAAESLAAPGSADRDAAHRSDCERLLVLLSALPDRERELISLKYGAGLTNRALARVTGLGESNVGTILHRTIAGLRERWDRKETHHG
jgi:RNA polymerase sigma-70 factor (ECF subfamily)